MRLLVNTAEWLLSKGSNQWNALLRGEDTHNTPESVSKGEVYLFRQEPKIVGMVILLPQPNAWDLDVWGAKASDNTAVYVHRLAINRKFAGQGVGRHIMNWVETEAPALGKRVVRLDCLANNEVLNGFYSGLGYDFLGKASNAYGEYSKYEKRL
jgi:ribosomal protein S18 acetylase RimI-like enzyme